MPRPRIHFTKESKLEWNRAYNRKYYLEHKGSRKFRDSQRDAQRAWRRHTKEILIQSLGGRCIRCGWNEHPFGLEFDHINPKQKENTPARILYSVGMEKSHTYIKKNCQLLCANCHALKTTAFSDSVTGESGDMSKEKALWFSKP